LEIIWSAKITNDNCDDDAVAEILYL